MTNEPPDTTTDAHADANTPRFRAPKPSEYDVMTSVERNLKTVTGASAGPVLIGIDRLVDEPDAELRKMALNSLLQRFINEQQREAGRSNADVPTSS